jgi:hypothetical protein
MTDDRQQRDDLQDRDTNVGGRDDQAAKAGRTAGQGAGGSDTVELGLGGTAAGAGYTAGAGGDLPDIDDDERPGTGLETGAASLGSSSYAATRVDTFNVPRGDDQRDGEERRIDPRQGGRDAGADR